MKKLLHLLAFTVLSIPVHAAVISEQDDFSDVSDWQLNGTALQNGNRLALTQTTSQGGSAFLNSAVPLLNDTSFSAFFQFEITVPSGITDTDGLQGADGLVFVVQTNSNSVGGIGGSIGYGGISNSVGIEFDTWQNGGLGDDNGNHVGINTGGSLASIVQTPEALSFNTGGVWSAWIDYNGLADLFEVRWSNNGVRSAAAGLSLTVDLTAELGTNDAYFGFTSGTASAGGLHEILSYEFRNDFNPIVSPTPANTPAVFSLILLGLLGITTRKLFSK